jgi:hypothetical protein
MYVLMCTSDCLLVGDDASQVQDLYNLISPLLPTHCFGLPASFDNIAITVDETAGSIKLDQTEYARQLLRTWDMDGSTRSNTPQPSTPLVAAGELLDAERQQGYEILVSSLQYLSHGTRPDLAQPVQRLAQFAQKPTTLHWGAAMHLLRYLNGTADKGILFHGTGELQGFCDADFVGDADTRCSTTGFIFTISSGALAWLSELQKRAALSTMESEYRSANAAGCEAVRLQLLLSELDTPTPSVTISCDNEAALCLLRNPMATKLSKHIDPVHHYARNRALLKDLVFTRIDTSKKVSDNLTKHVPADKLAVCCSGVNLV